MTAKDVMKLIRFIKDSAQILGAAVDRLEGHDPKDVDEILPAELRLQVAQTAARLRAAKKFED